MLIQRSIHEPLRQGMDTMSRWHGPDAGLIACWERGREKSMEDPELAEKARNGELVPLPWKGGVEKKIKASKRYGTYRYLTMWQGLRGDDLKVDTERDTTMICSAFGVSVIFTDDINKYGEP